MERPIRVVILTEIPAPFRIPIFNALAARPDVDPVVLFLSERDPRRAYALHEKEIAFRWEVLRGWSVSRGSRWLVLSRGVLGRLGRLAPDVVVVGGWNQPAFWLALLYARARRVPAVLWVESTARDTMRVQAPLAGRLRRAAARRAAGFLVPGRASAAYVAQLGVGGAPVRTAPNAVDSGIFGERVQALRTRREELREELGLSRCTFLYVGRLEREKGPDVLVRAMAGVRADLVVVGDGSLRGELARTAPPGTRFVGRLAQDELPRWYAAADALVVPSRSDVWGMVVTEGASAGLPLVVSDVVGAGEDLVDEGVSGFRVPADDEKALAVALVRLASDERLRRSAGRRSLELAARFTPEAWAESVACLARQLAADR